ncbi:hypothetical protein BGP_6572 [Beggiatoa sp. PS]|nr:hypothetical protein BGP_6572 [Beggiatoa sp. PS]
MSDRSPKFILGNLYLAPPQIALSNTPFASPIKRGLNRG